MGCRCHRQELGAGKFYARRSQFEFCYRRRRTQRHGCARRRPLPIWLIALSAGPVSMCHCSGSPGVGGWWLTIDCHARALRFLASTGGLVVVGDGTGWHGSIRAISTAPKVLAALSVAVTLGHLIENLAPIGFAAGLTFSVTAGLATLLGLWALALDIAELSLLGPIAAPGGWL